MLNSQAATPPFTGGEDDAGIDPSILPPPPDCPEAIVAYRCHLFLPREWTSTMENEARRQHDLWDKLIGIEEDYVVAKIDLESHMPAAAPGAAKEVKAAIAREWRAMHKKELDALRARRTARVEAAAGEAGLWWPNKAAVLENFETAAREEWKRGGILQAADRNTLRFRYQLNRGRTSWAQIVAGANPEISVRYIGKREWPGGTGMRKGKKHAEIEMTLYRANGERVCGKWQMLMPRDIPPGARLAVVQIVCRRGAPNPRTGFVRQRWSAIFYCAHAIPRHAPAGAVSGIAPDWTMTGDRQLRFAVEWTARGPISHTLPAEWVRRWQRRDSKAEPLPEDSDAETAFERMADVAREKRRLSRWRDDIFARTANAIAARAGVIVALDMEIHFMKEMMGRPSAQMHWAAPSQFLQILNWRFQRGGSPFLSLPRADCPQDQGAEALARAAFENAPRLLQTWQPPQKKPGRFRRPHREENEAAKEVA